MRARLWRWGVAAVCTKELAGLASRNRWHLTTWTHDTHRLRDRHPAAATSIVAAVLAFLAWHLLVEA